MKTIRPANYSMHLPPELKDKIRLKVERGHYSSVASFLIEAARQLLNSKQ